MTTRINDIATSDFRKHRVDLTEGNNTLTPAIYPTGERAANNKKKTRG
jgi:hypothetical protein